MYSAPLPAHRNVISNGGDVRPTDPHQCGPHTPRSSCDSCADDLPSTSSELLLPKGPKRLLSHTVSGWQFPWLKGDNPARVIVFPSDLHFVTTVLIPFPIQPPSCTSSPENSPPPFSKSFTPKSLGSASIWSSPIPKHYEFYYYAKGQRYMFCMFIEATTTR